MRGGFQILVLKVKYVFSLIRPSNKKIAMSGTRTYGPECTAWEFRAGSISPSDWGGKSSAQNDLLPWHLQKCLQVSHILQIAF